MPTFVDFAGMNTLILSTGSFDENNIIQSQVNPEFSLTNSEEKLVGINLHRNGPYGYCSWKQLRVSENPITRYHGENSTMTFVTRPGPVRNVLQNGNLRVRDRYSALHKFREPDIVEKAYPLLWNVGRHFKGKRGNINLFKFSVLSSFANEHIGFANQKVDNLLNYDSDEETSAYRPFYEKYADGGLNDQDSELTHWEFIRYRETVFPHMKNQFQKENLERSNFTSFYRHSRENRTKLRLDGGSFPIALGKFGPGVPFYESDWILDEEEYFLTRTYDNANTSVTYDISSGNQLNSGLRTGDVYLGRYGEGSLLNTLNQYVNNAAISSLGDNNASTVSAAASALDALMSCGPLYMRRISLNNTASVSNPSGMVIPQTGGLSSNKLFQGGALWEAGPTRQIKDDSGSYVSSPRYPFYDSYSEYNQEVRRKYKNFSLVSEFRMSTQVEDYLANGTAIELDMFEVTGGTENAQNSSQSQFYEVYSNSDFMRQFELINEDHKDFTTGKVLSLRCKAVKKFLPYKGFYPAQRTADLAKRFYDSFKNNISLYNANGIQLPNFNFGRQMALTPLFAPGVLFNTIKSGVAVDYPIITGSLSTTSSFNDEHVINKDFDLRIPFEALVEPKNHLSSIMLTSNEPHPSGNLQASAIWDGEGDELYTKMANNFLAEVPEFFLPDGNFTALVSKKQGDGIILENEKVYGMRVFMARSYDNPRFFVYHDGAETLSYPPPQDIIRTGNDSFRENFTMYSRPSAFGPPVGSLSTFSGTPLQFDQDRLRFGGAAGTTEFKSSVMGYNFCFTPPYYHGEAWCDIWITGSGQSLTIEQIQAQSTASFTRFDNTFYTSPAGASFIATGDRGPQRLIPENSPYGSAINKNAVQLSSSLNIFGIGKTSEIRPNELIVDTALDQDARWVIQTKFETPMLNFNHISHENGNLSIPVYGSESVPRGMWHQYGRIPEESEGVSIGVKPINANWQTKAMGRTKQMENLAEVLGFSSATAKLGRIRNSKTVYEAVVAVPYIEKNFDKKFFSIDKTMVQKYKAGGTIRQTLTSGDPQNQIGRSVLNQLEKMERYIFPPSFDFLNNDVFTVEPIAMYIFEFSHTFSQQDLADIWQNLTPDIGLTMEDSEVAITHPLLKKELLGEGGTRSGNTHVEMDNQLKWMVFKVKQRAASNYFKKTVLRNPLINSTVESSDVTQDEFGSTSKIQYNWPYDFFSLVELIKIDAEVEFGNFNEGQLENYVDSIPSYVASTTDDELLEDKINGMENGAVSDGIVPPEVTDAGLDAFGSVANIPGSSPSTPSISSTNPGQAAATAFEETPGIPGQMETGSGKYQEQLNEFQQAKVDIKDFIDNRMDIGGADERSRRVQKRMLRKAKKAAKRKYEFSIDKYPNLEKYVDNYQWGILK